MEWDIAAAHCIVREAGGSVTDTSGVELRYNKADLRNPHFVASGDPPFAWQSYL
jgi:3'(2'), 5'-bisphosphate nucleotidase